MARPISCARTSRRSSLWRCRATLDSAAVRTRASRPRRTPSSFCSTATCASLPIFWRRCSKVFAIPSLRRLLPDLLQRPREAARRERADTRLVGRRWIARASSHRRCRNRSLPLLLWRRRLVRFRSREISRTGRLRPAAGAVLSGRHRPRFHGLEARMEGAVSTAQRGVSRASRHYRQALPRRPDPSGTEEELPPVLLEEHPRVAQARRRISRLHGPAR